MPFKLYNQLLAFWFIVLKTNYTKDKREYAGIQRITTIERTKYINSPSAQ